MLSRAHDPKPFIGSMAWPHTPSTSKSSTFPVGSRGPTRSTFLRQWNTSVVRYGIYHPWTSPVALLSGRWKVFLHLPQGSSLLALHQLLITYIYLTYAWLILDYLSRHRSLHISSLSRAHVFQKPVFFDFFRYIWEKQIFEGLWRLFFEKNMIFEGFSACFWRSLMFVIFVYSAATLLHSYSGHTANYSYSG